LDALHGSGVQGNNIGIELPLDLPLDDHQSISTQMELCYEQIVENYKIPMIPRRGFHYPSSVSPPS
jgi:hypothetical protein